jgi:hypothetical protein
MATTDFLKILQTLSEHEVKFVVVGAMSRERDTPRFALMEAALRRLRTES